MNELDEKVRENRWRRIAARRGYVLTKSRYRDQHALGYGGFILADLQNRAVLGTSPFAYSATLDDVEDYFREMENEQRREERSQRLRTVAGGRQAVALKRKKKIVEKQEARRAQQAERRTEQRFASAMRGRVARKSPGEKGGA